MVCVCCVRTANITLYRWACRRERKKLNSIKLKWIEKKRATPVDSERRKHRWTRPQWVQKHCANCVVVKASKQICVCVVFVFCFTFLPLSLSFMWNQTKMTVEHMSAVELSIPQQPHANTTHTRHVPSKYTFIILMLRSHKKCCGRWAQQQQQ